MNPARPLLAASLLVTLAAACQSVPLPTEPLPTEPLPTVGAPPRVQAACTIEPDAAADPDDPLLDVRVEVVQRCAYCDPVSVRVAEAFPIGGAAARWLGAVTIDYGRESVDVCDVLRAGVPYPALATWVDVDRNGRCDPGVDLASIDQRYTWGFRDEVVHVDLLDAPPPVATADLCRVLPAP